MTDFAFWMYFRMHLETSTRTFEARKTLEFCSKSDCLSKGRIKNLEK